MDRVRGGVFSGAMLLAGLSATLLSGLIAIGIRQVTMTAARPLQVTVQHDSGEVAVAESPLSVSPSAASGAAEPSLARAHTYRPTGVVSRAGVSHSSGTTTGSATAGGSLKAPARAVRPPVASPRPSPAAHGKRHAKGNGKATAKGPSNGPTNGKGGNGHHR
jgi:hypothetical protein